MDFNNNKSKPQEQKGDPRNTNTNNTIPTPMLKSNTIQIMG